MSTWTGASSWPGNDTNYILYTVFVHPGNGSAAANFVVQGQTP